MVSPTTHTIKILPPRKPLKVEPVSPNLIASLSNPESNATNSITAFFPDGKRLLTAGYPSGLVQIWDLDSKSEIQRFRTQNGLRGSSEYVFHSPDWKTLLVPVERRSVKTFERDGKSLHRYDFSGEILSLDIATGKENPPLLTKSGSAPVHAMQPPGGRLLACVERFSQEAGRNLVVPDETVIWDLETQKKWKLCDDFTTLTFHPDGKSAAGIQLNEDTRATTLKTFDLYSGKEGARFVFPDTKRYVSIQPMSPDGSLFPVQLGGKLGGPVETWFFDSRTLEIRGKITGQGHEKGYGWSVGAFSPDGKHYFLADRVNRILRWDVKKQLPLESLSTGGNHVGSRNLAFSPDGKTLALAWTPNWEPSPTTRRILDPMERPQPRISLLDLTGKTPTKILIAPHGLMSVLRFSPDGKTLAFGSSGATHLFDLTK